MLCWVSAAGRLGIDKGSRCTIMLFLCPGIKSSKINNTSGNLIHVCAWSASSASVLSAYSSIVNGSDYVLALSILPGLS